MFRVARLRWLSSINWQEHNNGAIHRFRSRSGLACYYDRRHRPADSKEQAMRLVATNSTQCERGHTERIVRIYTGGIREVVHIYHHGESWSRYIIIPRRQILNEIRKLRERGCPIAGHWTFWELLPEEVSNQMIRSESYGGPGRPFTHRPYKVRSRSRKYIVISQSGGLDI